MELRKKIVISSVIGVSLINPYFFKAYGDSVEGEIRGVVTLGESLSEEQKNQVYNYLGVKEGDESLEVIEVTNKDEREMLGGLIDESKIGSRTYSCAYVEPTESGGVNVKTANLTYVDGAMIASTLMTSGVENANVIAVSPIKVSGTGALTGVMKAYEKATGEELEESKKELANEELVQIGELGEEIGTEKALGLITDVKEEVIKNGITDTTQIAETIENVANTYNIEVNLVNKGELTKLMEGISKEGYNYSKIEGTLGVVRENVDKGLERLGEEIERRNIVEKVLDWVNGLFTPKEVEEEKDLGILEGTNDEALGEGVEISATDERVLREEDIEKVVEEGKNFIEKVVEKVKEVIESIFGGNKEEVIEGVPEGVDNTTTEGSIE